MSVSFEPAGSAAPSGDTAAQTGADNSSASNGGGADTGSKGSPGSGSDGGKATDWYSGLDADTRKLVDSKGWKADDGSLKNADVLKSYAEAQKLISSRPGEQSYKAADYTFAPPENAEKIGYDSKMTDAFKELAAKHRVSPDAAKAIHDWYVGNVSGSVEASGTAAAERLTQTVSTAEADLSKAWGNPNTAEFKVSMEFARRAVANLDPGLYDALVETGVLVKGPDGRNVVANATVFKALAAAGQAMYREDSLFGVANSAENPFDGDDMAAQSQMVKKDPDRAERLIRALPADKRQMWEGWLTKRSQK